MSIAGPKAMGKGSSDWKARTKEGELVARGNGLVIQLVHGSITEQGVKSHAFLLDVQIL